jgi:hypothetical protein
VTLQWTAVPDEGYWVCWDTSDNGSCDTGWWPNGAAAARVLEGLSAGTYSWQVRTAGGGILADNGTWYHFTVGAPPARDRGWRRLVRAWTHGRLRADDDAGDRVLHH